MHPQSQGTRQRDCSKYIPLPCEIQAGKAITKDFLRCFVVEQKDRVILAKWLAEARDAKRRTSSVVELSRSTLLADALEMVR
jgi:hypothetical protein